MIIILTELQKEHLQLLHQHSTQVLIDFCKLAVDYINNGTNLKKYEVAAEKLQVSQSTIQNLVHALVYLIFEGSKHSLSDSDFKSSIALAGFSNEQQDVITKLYNTKKKEIYEVLHLIELNDPKYIDFSWRFEVQVASRSTVDEEIKPTVTMNFVTMKPKNVTERDMLVNKKQNGTNYVINTSIEEAKASSHCQNIVKHSILQCDIPNLINLTNKLEQALKESKSQHVRKVQRAL